MTALSQSTRLKLSLLQLAEEFGNVSKARRLTGYHRNTFCEVRRFFQAGGVAARVEEQRGPQAPSPNRVEPESEKKIPACALDHPRHGHHRVAEELSLAGLSAPPVGVPGAQVAGVVCSLALAKVYTPKMPVIACNLLFDRPAPAALQPRPQPPELPAPRGAGRPRRSRRPSVRGISAAGGSADPRDRNDGSSLNAFPKGAGVRGARKPEHANDARR